MTWFGLVTLAFACYRVTRFFQLDSMLETVRVKASIWLQIRPQPRWRRWIHKWMTCPFCQSVWFAWFLLMFWTAVTDYTWRWVMIVDWLAIAGAAMVPYRYIDPPPACIPTKRCDE